MTLSSPSMLFTSVFHHYDLDYDGFESDEAMGGSSDDDDDDDGDDDDDDDDDELSDEEESEKDSTGKNIWTGENEKKEDERRAGESTVEEPGCDRWVI